MPSRKRFTDDSYHKEPWFRALCDALLSSKTEPDMQNMLRDIGTLSELQAWSERLEVAKQLSRGLSYREVSKNTGASTTTVTRVAKFIENGTGGYRKYLKVHRHHRMIPKSAEAYIRAQSKPQDNAPKPNPTSPLQKYLDRK